MSNFVLVLFKNKKKKRIIKEYKTLNGAKTAFDKMMKKSNETLFDVQYENGKECKYELGIIENSDKQLVPVYLTDELGRNVKVKLEESGKTLFQVSLFKKEELIFDLQKKKKISVSSFLRNYMRGDEMRMLYSLNNKVILQENSEFNLFSLKNEGESQRFIDCISNYNLKNNTKNCMFIKDTSTPQKKYLLNLLESYGIDKKILYRKSTTHPR